VTIEIKPLGQICHRGFLAPAAALDAYAGKRLRLGASKSGPIGPPGWPSLGGLLPG